MKIVYYAGFSNKQRSDDTEGHIAHSLEKLGHEVECVQEGSSGYFSGDLFLFHKAPIEDLKKVVFNGPKVCWYFDKVWDKRVKWMKDALEWADKIYITDGGWVKNNPNEKFEILYQGIGDDLSKGVRRDFEGKIVFTGEVYGERYEFVQLLNAIYESDFKVYCRAFNQVLRDLCVSIPIFVAPKFPSDDHYWSSRVYQTIGSGGFLIHPYCSDLAKEYEDGKEIVYYRNNDELKEKIDYYLAHPEERERIRMAGYEKTIKNYTYTQRIKQLCSPFSK